MATAGVAGTYPKIGNKAPAFSATASNGQKVKLADFSGQWVVLYFYPKDNTPGCTKEACGFRDAHKKLTSSGAVVLGVSPDSLKSHERFVEKFGLPFLLLSDEDHKICEKYGVWQKKKMAGREYMGVVRTTVLINPDGRVAHVFEKVKADGHDQEVLAWLKDNG